MLTYEYFNRNLLKNAAEKIERQVGVLTPPAGYAFGVLSALTNLEQVSATIVQDSYSIRIHTLGVNVPTEAAVVAYLDAKTPEIVAQALLAITTNRYVFTTTAGQSSIQISESLQDKVIDLYWNGQLITQDGNWTVSNNTINLLFTVEAGDIIVVMVGAIRQSVGLGDLAAHNNSTASHANLMTAHNADLLAHQVAFEQKATKVIVRRW